MSGRIRRKIAVYLHRSLPLRLARRFVRHENGSAAIEFGFIAAPFIGLMFAILETALVFFAGQTLETAASEAGRLVMTGQAASFSQSDFKTQVCAILDGGMFDCVNKVYINVATYNSFGSVNNTAPVNNGTFDTTQMTYQPGGPNCIVAVTLYYQWPVYVTYFGDNLTNLNGGNRLLVATSVFRNEPYGPAAC